MRHAELHYHEGPRPSREGLEGVSEISYEIRLEDVRFTRQARITIGMAISEIASMLATETSQITRHIPGRIFCLATSGRLMIECSVPELEADMFIEIPANHWHFRTHTTNTQ